MNENLQQALNDQINNELYAAYLYLSMAEHFQANNLLGFAHWMRLQQMEETAHAMKIFDFVLDRNGRVTFQTIDAPVSGGYESTLDVARKALAHDVPRATGDYRWVYLWGTPLRAMHWLAVLAIVVLLWLASRIYEGRDLANIVDDLMTAAKREASGG